MFMAIYLFLVIIHFFNAFSSFFFVAIILSSESKIGFWINILGVLIFVRKPYIGSMDRLAVALTTYK